MVQINEHAIVLENIAKTFGNVKAVSKVSLKIVKGSSVAIYGPSGCGKTTLLRLIAGLEKPDEGVIYLNGIKASTPNLVIPPNKRDMGFVFQSPSLWPHMNLIQNMLFGLGGISKNEKERCLAELFDVMELKGLEKRYPCQISGGQAKRVALARTLAHEPSILLMDEPLTNLDPELKKKMIYYIKERVRKTGAVLLYVTHDETEASEFSDKLILMRGGCIEVN